MCIRDSPKVDVKLGINESYTIKPGYHTGEDVVSQSGIPTSQGLSINPTAGGQTVQTAGTYYTSDTYVQSCLLYTSQEYSNAEKEIQKISQALDRAIERQIKFYETGGNIKSRAFAGMEYDIEQLSRQLDEANERKKQLVSSGKAFTLGKDTDKFSQMSVRYEKESQKLANTSAILGTTFAKVEDELNKYKERLRGIDNSQKKAQKSGKKFNNELRSTGKNAKKAPVSYTHLAASTPLNTDGEPLPGETRRKSKR